MYWIPLWNDWYTLITGTEGVRRVTFDSEVNVVTVTTAGGTILCDGSTPLEAIAKAGFAVLTEISSPGS